MRHLLHFGILVLALAAVTRADAQEIRRHDSRRTVSRPSPAAYELRRAYYEEREELQQIIGISERWERATASRDREAQWIADRQITAWLEREIRESARDPYTQRFRMLGDELATLEQSKHRSYGHHDRYDRHHYGREKYASAYHRHGHYDRGGYYGKKSRILNELVALSERQVRRAEAGLRYPVALSFARR
jgi:hypothetical protein